MDPSLQTNTLNPSSQNSTQNPQIAGTSGGNVANTGGVQPGTASALLESVNGIPLSSSALPAVNLNSATTTTVQSSPRQISPKHHVNAGLLGLAALLLVVAIISFLLVNRSVKSTT